MVLCVLLHVPVYYDITSLYTLQCVTSEESSQYFSSPDKTNQTKQHFGVQGAPKSEFYLLIHSAPPMSKTGCSKSGI